MMRKLVLFLAAATMVAMPLAANALGFGSIKLNSALGEPLDARIELLSPTPDDISNLKVKLAPRTAFLRAGIDRPLFLEKLKFAVKQMEDGTYYIHVTTRERVREPFLDFLLEMEWRNGRMVREYTMLLDPPGTAPRTPAVVEAPATVAPEQVAREEQAAPAATPFAAPVAAPEPEPVPVPAPIVEAPATAEVPAESDFVLAEGEQMPRIPLTESTEPEPVVEAPAPQVAEPPAPEPVPVPVPVEEEAAVATPVPVPVEEEAVAVAPVPEAEVVPLPESATFGDDAELFPRIPLTAYGEPARPEAPAPGELDYGIVRKGDTLWQIAEKVRPDESVSIYQVMLALLKSNPNAFVDNNINRLKVGHVLRIEDPAMLTAISTQEARQEFQSQMAVWEEYRHQVAEQAGVQPIVAEEAVTEPAAEPEAGGELTLASPDGAELQTGAGTSEEVVNDNIVALRDELRQLREDSAAAGIDNPELNARLQDLDEELDRMQRAVSISDDELAALQQQLAQLQARTEAPAIVAEEPAIVTEEPVVTEEVTEAAVEVTEAAVGETPDGEQVVAVTETGETVAEPEAAAPAEQAPPETGAGPSPVELAEQIAAQEPAVTTEPEPATPAAEEGVLGMVMGTMKSMGQVLEGIFGSALIVFVGLPVLLVLIIVGLILLKRRSKADKYQESILTGGPASVTGVQEVKESEEESSFLSDFAVSGAGAIQGDDSEVDPLTEADVFIAYGRYEAAEERLKEAIDNDPGRNELKLKLIELYHTTKNKPAFENSAAEFYAALGEGAAENPLWQKVAAMGAELVPGNPLFSGGQPSELPDMAGAADPGVGLSDSQVMDIGLDTGVFGNEELGTTQKPQPAGEPETAAEEGGLDFNLDLGTPASEPETEKESTADLDFSLDTGGAEEPAAGAPAEPSAAGSDFSLNAGGVVAEPEGGAEELSGLDFNLETSDMPQPAVQEEAGSEPDLDLSSASISLADLEEVNTTDDTSEMTMDFDKMAPAEPVPDEPSSQTMAFDMEAGTEADADVGGADEVGTKLDLAKAYIDMGDPDGARSILDEVMDEGNEAQKQEAQQLLQQIA